MYRNPVDINRRLLCKTSSQEQEEMLWGAGVHVDHSALYAYAGSLPSDFQAASYLLCFRQELRVVFLCWPSPQGVIAQEGDLSMGY